MRISKPSYQESSTPNEFVVVLLGDDENDQGLAQGLAQGGQGLAQGRQGLDTQGQWLDAVLAPVAGGSSESSAESVGMEDWLSPKHP